MVIFDADPPSCRKSAKDLLEWIKFRIVWFASKAVVLIGLNNSDLVRPDPGPLFNRIVLGLGILFVSLLAAKASAIKNRIERNDYF